jgi:hypothetical protein
MFWISSRIRADRSATISCVKSGSSSSDSSRSADIGGSGMIGWSGFMKSVSAVPVSVPPCRIRVISSRKISPPAARTSFGFASDAESTLRNAEIASNTAEVQVSRRMVKSDMGAPGFS